MKYAKAEMGLTTKAMETSQELLKDIFNDIDENKDGTFSRDEMFEHLKKTRDLQFERQESAEGSLSEQTPKVNLVPGFAELQASYHSSANDLDLDAAAARRLSASMNTPLALPSSPEPRRPSDRSDSLKLEPLKIVLEDDDGLTPSKTIEVSEML